MENSSVTRIPAIRHELRHMIMQRNELACYVRERLQLPPMIQDERKCGRCYAKTECFLYHKLAEDGTTESAGVKEKFNELVGKLQAIHQDFFKKWDNLLTKEESEMMKFRRELWTMLSTEREKLGRCFSEVVIEQGSMRELNDMTKINRYRYTLVKKDSLPDFSFTESQITVGEPIVISSEKGHFALANGYVTKVSRGRITVAVDRRLHNARQKQADFDAETNQTFCGIMEVGREDENGQGVEESPTIYRLDKDEFSNGMATVRNNLLALMDDNVYRSAELRKLIVEDTSPVFKAEPAAYALSGPASQLQINKDQRAAIDKVMSAKDYALVLGMPGTGKTTTIAHIIRALVARGKSVLLTSYTHTAVDNILLKLRDSEASILRLGTLAKIHPEVQEFAHLAATPKQSMEELQDTYMKPEVVATTCLGVNHQLFQRRVFDYCIVDEASQITLPVCLGPIRMARTFVLVGDHYQLPPLVQNREAQEGGLDISLFKLLSERHPESVVNLEHQYRMCEEVQLLSKTLIYSGRLKCGNDAVAKRTLKIPALDGLQQYHLDPRGSYSLDRNICLGPTESNNCWLSDILSPDRKVVFANTDTLCPMPKETAVGSRIVNTVEANLIIQLVLSLISQGIPPTEIGVIAFYRSQLALLRQLLKSHPEASGVEMHTADKFQGRDKEVVFISCVRSNDAGNVGDLLRDWRRVNVAFTRARSKMVILGSKGTLSAGNELLDKFVKLVEGKKWVYDLPGAADRGHGFDGFGGVGSLGTQMTPVKVVSCRRIDKDDGEGEDRGEKKRKLNPLAQRKGIEDFMPLAAATATTTTSKSSTHQHDKSINKPFKVPGKVAKVGTKALFGNGLASSGSNNGSGKRAVLMDIVNDALGDGI
jgi:DNA replication ATP-dependent helicase Dna2